MTLSRRDTLKLFAASAGAGLAGNLALPAWAQAKPELAVQILGYTLSIHIPAITALHEGLPALGYPKPKMDRMESMQVLTQSLVANSVNFGESDVVSALRASAAGADLRITGLVYNNTSQVLVVNADQIKDFKDLEKPGNVIAFNSKGDFIYVLLSGIMARRGVDIDKVTFVEVGGSGSRMRALLAGRVSAVPVHFDQAAKIVKQGNYKVLANPTEVFDPWLSEVWLSNAKWLEQEGNRRAAVDLQKATIASFRKANSDFNYFAESYRKYATVKGAAEATDDELRPVWSDLVNEIKAWPNDGGFKRAYFDQLLPVYRDAEALDGDPNLDRLVDTSIVEQALQELG